MDTTPQLTRRPAGQQLMDYLRAVARALPFTRRWAAWWVRTRDVRIASGVGAGLRLKAGPSNPAYAFGTNEPAVQQALALYLRPGDVFYDIGANIGFFTLIGCRLVGPSGRVVAFEPLPANAALTRHNLALNAFSQATVIEAAVARESGLSELQVAHYSGGSALASATPPPDLAGLLRVKTVAIDSLTAEGQLPPPSVVKIDVEGAEMEVLRGMAQTLRRRRPVVIYEIDDGSREAFEAKRAACEQFLAGHGYQITALAPAYPGADWIVGHYVAVAG